MKKILIVFLYFTQLLLNTSLTMLSPINVSAQSEPRIDSLKIQLEKHYARKRELGNNVPELYDTAAANILSELSLTYWFDNYGKAMDYAKQCLTLSEQIGYKKGMAAAYNGMGVINLYKGNYVQAHEFLSKALKIREEINDQRGIGSTMNNLGAAYYSQAIYAEALKYYLAALKVNERTGSKMLQADNYGNIGIVYSDMGNYTEALKYLTLALKMREEIGIKENIVMGITNIGEMYIHQGNLPEALKQLYLALELNKDEKKSGLNASALIFIGKIKFKQGNYADALKNLFEGLKISEELEEKSGIADCYNLIGAIYSKQGKFIEAADYLNKALLLSKEMGSLEKIGDSYEFLTKLDSTQGDFSKALEHFKLFITYHDSIQNNEITNKTTGLQLQYDTEKKEQQITLLTKESKLQQTELQKQNTSRNVLIVACGLIALLAGIIYNRYRIKQKANAEIETTLQHLKNTQEQLIEHEKLASLGKFTAEVAREIEVPVKQINQLNKISRSLILSIKNSNSEVDAASLKNNLQHIFNYGKEADAVVKKVLTETRKLQL